MWDRFPTRQATKKSCYLKYVKLNKILIKFPLIWHMVRLCGLYIGIKLVALDKAVHFFTDPPPFTFYNFSGEGNKKSLLQSQLIR